MGLRSVAYLGRIGENGIFTFMAWRLMGWVVGSLGVGWAQGHWIVGVQVGNGFQKVSRLPATMEGIRQVESMVLGDYLREGYWYAQLRLRGYEWRSVRRNSWGLVLRYEAEKGQKVIVDSVWWRGPWPGSRRLFERITGLERGKPLSQASLENLRRRLRTTPYAQLLDTPRVWLFPTFAWVEVPLRKTQANQLDATLGILPSGTSTRPQVVGQGKLVVVSPLKAGEVIHAQFEFLPQKSQRLRMEARLPHLWGSRWGIGGGLQLWRQDTTFLMRNWQAVFSYRPTFTLEVHARYADSRSILLSAAQYSNLRWPPPPQLDLVRRGWGIGFVYKDVDVPVAPRRGWYVTLEGQTQNIFYPRNPLLRNFEYARLPVRMPSQVVEGELIRYFPAWDRGSVVVGTRGLGIFQQLYFENELPRLGGVENLRGFNENQIPAKAFGQLYVEGRLMIEAEGFLGIWGEGSWVDRFWGGPSFARAVGITLQTATAAGVLRIQYAIGSWWQEPFYFGRGRLHLQWLSTF
ncbi:MAG: hypothetical protein ACUVRD_07095 [Bacteroidia bacterium]